MSKIQITATNPNHQGASTLTLNLEGAAQTCELMASAFAIAAGVPYSDVVKAAIARKIKDVTRLAEGCVSGSGDGLYFPASLIRYGQGYDWARSKFETESERELIAQAKKVAAALKAVIEAAKEAHKADSDKITEETISLYFPMEV